MDVPFVGRGREQHMLSRALDDLSEGHGSTVLIVGAAGIGKTALVAQLGGRAGSAGVPILSGAASPDLGSPAFWPWRQALSSSAATSCGLSRDLLGVQPATESVEFAAAARFATVDRTRDGLTLAGRPAGLVVVLEDMHWADGPSLHLLDHICSEVARSRLLVVVTARDPLGSELGALRGASTLLLGPLGQAEVADGLGPHADPSWPPAVHHLTGGNPLYLAELLRHVDPAALRRPVDLPPGSSAGTSRLVATRLARLSPPCRRLLDGAAVAGDRFDLDLVGARACAPAEDLDEVVDEAVRAGVLVEDRDAAGWMRWSHALVRQAWAGQTPRAERLAWHRELAERLDGRGTQHQGEVARHRLAAATDRSSRLRAAAACRAAAAVASRDLDFAGAYEWLSRALPLVDDDAARAQTLLAIGQAAYRSGDVAEAAERACAAANVAGELDRVDLLVEAATLVRGIGGVSLESLIALCDRAEAALEGEESARRARVLAQHASLLADGLDVVGAAPLSERAMIMAVRAGDDDAVMEALHARHEVLGGLDGVQERAALGGRLLELAARARRPEAALWGHVWRIDTHLQLGATSELLAELFDLSTLASRIGWPLARWHLLRARATRAIQTGRFEEAAALALACQTLAEATEDYAARIQSGLVMTELRTLTGRYGELEPHAPDWEGSGAQWLPVSYATYGWHHLQAGEIDEAKALFHQVRPLLRALPVNARWMATVFRTGELAVAFDDTETVEIAYRLLLPYERYFAGQSAAYLGAIPRALGSMASARHDMDAADRLGGEAVAMETRIGAVPFTALAALAHARSLLVRGGPGDRVRARGILDRCLATARRLDMRPTTEAAARLLAESGGLTDGPAGLTSREREVASFMAYGMSNRDIAGRLVLSERTVETHVRHILAKLTLTNRTQVGAWARAAGLRTEDTRWH